MGGVREVVWEGVRASQELNHDDVGGRGGSRMGGGACSIRRFLLLKGHFADYAALVWGQHGGFPEGCSFGCVGEWGVCRKRMVRIYWGTLEIVTQVYYAIPVLRSIRVA